MVKRFPRHMVANGVGGPGKSKLMMIRGAGQRVCALFLVFRVEGKVVRFWRAFGEGVPWRIVPSRPCRGPKYAAVEMR